MSINFVEALSTDNLTAVKAAPKTDVHSHAFFSTRRENVERWVGRSLMKPPAKMEGLEGMMAYADAVFAPHIKHREGFEFVAVSAMNEAIQDGVVRLEMSFDIRLAEFYSNGLVELCAFIEALVGRYREEIDLCPELGLCAGVCKRPKMDEIGTRSNRIRHISVDRFV